MNCAPATQLLKNRMFDRDDRHPFVWGIRRYISILILLTLTLPASSCMESNATAIVQDPVSILDKQRDDDTLVIGTTDPLDDLRMESQYCGICRQFIWDSPAWNVVDGLNGWKTILMLLEKYKVSDGGKECVLTIKKSILFHDGSEMTSEDVAYTFESIKETFGNSKNKLNPINNSSFFHDFNVEVVDRYTLHLRSETSQEWERLFLNQIGKAGYERKYGDEPSDKYIPFGSGPYRFISYDREKRIIKLKRFEKYWSGTPKFKYVEVHHFNNAEATAIALLEGKVDYVNYLRLEDVDLINKRKNLTTFSLTSPFYTFLELNTESPKLNDKRTRLALSLLIDRERIVNDPAGLNGAGTAADSQLYFTKPVTKIEPVMPPDSQRALSLLQKAGWKSINGRLYRNGVPFTLEIIFNNFLNQESIPPSIRMVVQSWEDAGISCSIRAKDEKSHNMSRDQGDYEIALSLYQDGVTISGNMNRFTSKGRANTSRYKNLRMDKLFANYYDLDKLGGSVKDRMTIKRKMQAILREDAPSIMLYYQKDFFGASNKLTLDKSILKEPFNLTYLFRTSA